jgi:hypothetical protein
VVPVPAGGPDPQLEQIRERQAKLDEGAGTLVPIRRDIGQEWAGQPLAGEARHLPQGIQYRIADDVRVRPPPDSSGVGQNLAAAAILLRAMPEPSTTEGRRIQGEPPEGRGTPRNIAPRLLDSCGKPRSIPGARAIQRLRPRVASATSTITTAVGPTSTRGCAEATTPGVGDATTVGRIGVLRPNHPVRRLSAAPYDGAVPDPVPNPDYYHEVLGGDETGTVARELSASLPTGWNGR